MLMAKIQERVLYHLNQILESLDKDLESAIQESNTQRIDEVNHFITIITKTINKF